MAERRRTRGAVAGRRSAGERPPAGEPRRAGGRQRPADDELEPADDELEPADDELEPAEDELEPADDELEPAEDELEPAEDELEPAEEEEDEQAVGRSSANGEGRGRKRSRNRHASSLTARQAAESALRQVAELTAKRPEGITGLDRTDDGGWSVGVEVVEDRRIPSSADILATYQAIIDAGGELMSYQRVRRYARGRGDTYEGSLHATRKLGQSFIGRHAQFESRRRSACQPR